VISQVQAAKEVWIKQKKSQIVVSLLVLFVIIAIALASYLAFLLTIGRTKGDFMKLK
jgi:flagellar basal body-associated protein FliL